MNTEVMNPQDFQARMVERLREDVGKLIPDDKLAQMVEQAVQSMFFTRSISDNGYKKVELPSWWEKAIEAQLSERVRTFTTTYLREKNAELERALAETIKDTLPSIMAKIITELLAGGIINTVYSMQQDFENRLRNNGLIR